jgi:NADPH-dependent curcumin reductase CurA
VGLRNLWQLIVKQATIHGFLIAGYVDRFAEGGAQVAQWIGSGQLRADEDIQHGLENSYEAFMRLFSGANTGKLVLKIA